MDRKLPLKVIVTGARGFIGMRVLGPLVKSGAQVTALVRSGHDRGRMQAAGAHVAVAKLVPGAALDTALAGQDVLVNLAYDVRAGMAENLAAFEALMTAAKKAGIRRVVHLSSAVVYDAWPNGPIDEANPITDPGDGSYRNAKISMENSLLQDDFEAAILQPTIVFGPDSTLWTTGPMAALAGGGVVLPDPVGDCAAVYVDDVAQAIARAVDIEHLNKERFLISGGETLSWQQFYQGYRDIAGQGEITLKPLAELQALLGEDSGGGSVSGPSLAAGISANLRRIVGSRRFEAIMAKVSSARGATGPVTPDRHMLALLSAKPDISIAKAGAVLGYEPQFDFAKGLARVAAQDR